MVLMAADPASLAAQADTPINSDETSAQQELFEESLTPDPALELAGLLADDTESWLDALQVLRATPEDTRELLLLALLEDLASPNRWRLYHHMIEFGRREDIPLLLERLQTAENPLERRAIEGAARALYSLARDSAGDFSAVVGKPVRGRAEDLADTVLEFSFAQTKPPTVVEGSGRDGLRLSEQVFEAYHRESVPVRLIRRLLPLRGQSYADREQLTEALSHRLGRKIWRQYGKALLAPVRPEPELIAQEGLLRFTLRNPFDEPLMVRVSFNVWYARFDPAPDSRIVYLEAGTTQRVDIPIRLVKNQARVPVRVGMRMWEVNGPFVPIFQKLYVTF